MAAEAAKQHLSTLPQTRSGSGGGWKMWMQTHFPTCTDTCNTPESRKTQNPAKTGKTPHVPSFFRQLLDEARFTNWTGIVLERKRNMKTPLSATCLSLQGVAFNILRRCAVLKWVVYIIA